MFIEDAFAGVETLQRADLKCLAKTTMQDAGHMQAADMIIERLGDITVDH